MGKQPAPQKTCDETTIYTCLMEYREESGTVDHWHAIDIDELAKASHNPPDFTYPFERKTETWPDDCGCPNGCRRMVRDTRTKEHKGYRMARRRIGAGGTIFEITKTTFEYWKIEVDYVCARIAKEETLSMDFDPGKKGPARFPTFEATNEAFISSAAGKRSG